MKLLKILLLLILLLIISAMLYWKFFAIKPIVIADNGFTYKVHAGASFKSVGKDLQTLNILPHPYLFYLLVTTTGATHKLKAGEYFFAKGTTPLSLINQVITGRGQVLHMFTIIAGTTFKQVRENLDKNPDLSHTTTKLSDVEIMRMLGHGELNPEGEFYPDTYYFVADTPDLLLLKRSFKAMQKKLMNAWNTRSTNLPLQTPYQALIAASLIEKEAHLDSERPIIAGVMMNRLRKDILLQFDPTVIYGIGDKYSGEITHADLLADNAYNTYLHKGLPPTPIAIPGLSSIEAATHPQENDYYYFVATGDHVSHKFSKTLAEHNAAVLIYRH